MRISSTQLGRQLQCPRMYWYQSREDASGFDANAKTAFGSIFHAFAEFYGLKRRLPALSEFNEMKGTYDSPGEVRQRFPQQYIPAMETFLWCLNERPDLFEFPETARFELPIEEFGLTMTDGAIKAEGVIDVFLPVNTKTVLIRDYKTRGSFEWCPRTPADFRRDIQQCYYASAVAKAHPEVEDVIVQHVNVLRPDAGGPAIFITEARLPRWYLMGVWDFIESTLVPDMVASEEEPDEAEITRDKTMCWKYGKCRFLTRCTPHKDEANEMHRLIGIRQDADEQKGVKFDIHALLGKGKQT